METHAFASLAHLRILLVPVGPIPHATFESYSAEIRSFESLRLGEIPADAKDGRAARFLPNPLSTGSIQLSFPSHPPPRSHASLSLLRPSHFPLAVIGIAACSQSESLKALNEQFETSLRDVVPPSGLYPLVKNCWAFETTEETANLDAGANVPGLTIVPNISNRKLHIGTLLGALCSQILSEFGVLVEALENPLGNEYLNASIMPSLPPLSELPSSLSSLARNDNSPNLSTYNSSPDVARSSFSLGAVPNLKRNTSIKPLPSRQGTLDVQAQKKRMSTIGTSSSHGRLYKMLGDFFLLAGRIEDAMVWYNEAILLFKTTHDPLWFACTLEGIATVAIIEAWATGHGLNQSISTTKEPWTEVADKLQQAIVLYMKVSPPENEQTHSLLVLLYCQCVLRQTSLLFAVWSSKGWGPLAFSALLEPGPKPQIPPTLAAENSDNWLHLERLTHISGISRSSISASLTQIHGPWLLHLGQRERISVLEATASFYSCIGYQRKEAYILREVLGCILDLIVCGREEDGFSHASGVPPTAGLAIQNAQSGQTPAWGALGVRVSESDAGNAGVLKLLKYICKVLGIDLEAVRLLEDAAPPSTERTISLEEYDEDVIDELRESYGWPELQVGVVREASAVAEALPDFPSVAQFALSSLKTLQHILSPSDQYHLYSTANRALITARRRGDTRTIEYWSGKPVVSISIAPLPANRIPLEKPKSIQHSAQDAKPLVMGMPDPFLYNPRRVMNKGQTLLTQNEVVEFVVTLQNPYIFDLELEELSLSTSGASFQSDPLRMTIPANSLHQCVLSGKATATGPLTVRGCFVKAIGSSTREYVLPLYTTAEEERVLRKRRAIAAESGRIKYTGLDRYIRSKTSKHGGVRLSSSAAAPTPFKFMECKVVPEQPLLRVRRSSVTHGALMLYEGERSTIRLTLENISPIIVDFLHVAFEDSTMEPAQKALADGNLSVFETYETEDSLINHPVFSWGGDESQVIRPSQNLTMTFGCFGKVGCTNGTIHISYAGNANVDDPDVFYVRQISYPLMVTVYHMLECSGMDILQLPSYPTSDRQSSYNSKHDRLNALNFEDKTGWCLFSIEVRNTYGSPFDVTLVRTQDGETTASSSTTIPPGSVSRLVIPIRKILLSDEEVSKPIPTLSDRQFVVATSSLTKAEEKVQRELFWYREALLKCVQGRWQETGGIRSGDLSFREQRMTAHMVDGFRLEVANVSLSLESLEGSSLPQVESKGWRYYPTANEFVQLRATIKNLTPFPVVFTADFTVEPAEYVVHEGVISDLPVGRLDSGESRDVTMTLCFHTFGHFELSVQVQSFGTPETRVAKSHITAIVEDDS